MFFESRNVYWIVGSRIRESFREVSIWLYLSLWIIRSRSSREEWLL